MIEHVDKLWEVGCLSFDMLGAEKDCCGSAPAKFATKREAIAAWNTRSGDTAMKDGVDLEVGAKAIFESNPNRNSALQWHHAAVPKKRYYDQAKAIAAAWGLPTKQKEGI